MNRTSDEQMLGIDIPAAIAGGKISGETMVAAAIQADRLDVQPRSLAFLAEVVRRGGIPFATELPEPMPSAPQSALAMTWLSAAAGSDEVHFARWLDAVAAVLRARRAHR